MSYHNNVHRTQDNLDVIKLTSSYLHWDEFEKKKKLLVKSSLILSYDYPLRRNRQPKPFFNFHFWEVLRNVKGNVRGRSISVIY